MTERLPHIILDCERMRYPYTGLYYYCLHLGRGLLHEMRPGAGSIDFYLPSSLKDVFGANTNVLEQHAYHKMYLPLPKNKYTVWHATHQGTAYVPSGNKLPVVLTVHDLNFMLDDRKPNAKKQKYLAAMQKKLMRADHIIDISQFTLSELHQYFNLQHKPASVIYNGCNIATLNPQLPVIQPDAPFLFSIGTIAEKKNFHVLPALLAKNNWQLVIAGITQDKAYKERIIAEAAKWGVTDRLIFTGPVSENDKQWYYGHCKAFVFPSLAEGFGLPVIEAMYFGKPVFLSTATCLPEIGGDAAYYFSNFDPETMQECLEKGLLDYAATMPGSKIQQHAMQYNWNQAARAYVEVYQQFT